MKIRKIQTGNVIREVRQEEFENLQRALLEDNVISAITARIMNHYATANPKVTILPDGTLKWNWIDSETPEVKALLKELENRRREREDQILKHYGFEKAPE